MNVLHTITDILDPTGKLTATVAALPTGKVGAIAQAELPDGWVSLTYWPTASKAATTEYSGPVLKETPNAIMVEVFGEPLALLKSRCAITRPGGGAA